VKKAIQFIRDEQEPDGSWFGRWGVNYIYGTMLVLRGLEGDGDRSSRALRCSKPPSGIRMVQKPRRRLGRDLRLVR